MPGNPSIDRLDTLDCVERNGVIRQLTRVARVLGMSDYLDYRVLWQGLKKAGVPAYGSGLVDASTVQTVADTQSFNALVLVERNAKIADLDKGTVDVTLKYEHLLDGPNQWLQGIINGRKILFMKGRSSIVQKPTNFFFPNGNSSIAGTYPITDVFNSGDSIAITWNGPAAAAGSACAVTGVTGTVEANGTWTLTPIAGGAYLLTGSAFTNPWLVGGTVTFGTDATLPRIQILTGHRFPANDPTWPLKQLIAGGEIQLPYPQENERLIGFAWTANPFAYKRQIHRKVNSTNWLGQPKRSWLCTEVEHEVLDPQGFAVTPPAGYAGSPLYMFTFEFQYDSDTWDQTVTYIDSNTGLPPASVQPAVAADPLSNLVLDQQIDFITGLPFPAGYWQVPALPEVDYNTFFAQNFG